MIFLTQILREINFCDSRVAKSAILTLLKVPNFDFYEFLHVLKAEVSKRAKTAFLELPDSPKLISRKI